MTLGVLSDTKPKQLGTRFIDRHFGQQQSATSKWLRSTLLVNHDSNWNRSTGRCKTYTYSPSGVEHVRNILGLMNTPKTEIVTENIQNLFSSELNTKQFQYTEGAKSNRLVHPLQSYRREYKRTVLQQNNLTHEYDIVCCAPTLLHQFSWQFSHGHVLEHIDDYIINRSTIRENLAAQTQLPVENIKRILNALFAGARIAGTRHADIFQLCNNDPARILYLQQDSVVMGIRSDIRVMWKYLKPHLEQTGIPQIRTRGSTTYSVYLTPKNKWNLYFQLERSVLEQIRSFLDQERNCVFLEHDGFTSEKSVDCIALSDFIGSRTGFDVKFEKK